MGALHDRAAGMVRPADEPELVAEAVPPHQAVQEVDSLHVAQEVFIAHFDVDCRVAQPIWRVLHDRCGVFLLEAFGVERVSEQRGDATGRADLVSVRNCVPSQARPCAGLHGSQGPERLRVLEAKPQAAEAPHRDAGHHRGLASRTGSERVSQVRQELGHDERLPAVLAVIAVHVDRAGRHRWHRHDHLGQFLGGPHGLDLGLEPR